MSMEPKVRDMVAGAQPLAHEDMERLFARYDGLLQTPALPIGEADRRELYALAQIFDLSLPPEEAPERVWKLLRALLTSGASGNEHKTGAGGRSLTVLVVEDDPDAAESLMEYLTEAGHGVVGPFASAESAIAAAATHTLDAALVDINLAGPKTGVDLARTLHTDWGVPSVFVSGNAAEAEEHADIASAVVMKPYQGKDVLAALTLVARQTD